MWSGFQPAGPSPAATVRWAGVDERAGRGGVGPGSARPERTGGRPSPLYPLVVLVVLMILASVGSTVAWGQFGDAKLTGGPRLGEATTTQWKVGMEVRAVGGPCRGLFGTIPVPTDWPEQQVRIVNEDISPAVRSVRYRTLNQGVKQMLIQVPTLNAGEGARAVVTFQIERHIILPPENPQTLRRPQEITRNLRYYLAVSPFIEVRDPKIVALAKQLRNDELSAWSQVETIYDCVRDKVQYRNGKLKGAAAALRDGYGDCEELTSLFIALCRSNNIPARTVWVPNHCYPEFYLEDESGQGHWFPCQAAGARDFGGIPEERPILQKGDNFKVPERRERQRYVAEFLTGSAIRGGGKPSVRFVRQIVPKD